MSLIQSQTRWVLFLSASEHDPEERHIYDLVFGLLCLERAQIPSSQIYIYVDGQNRQNINNLFSIATGHAYNIKPTADFFTDMAQNTDLYLMMFVTGHGSVFGIDAIQPITPHMLLDSIKSAPNLDKAIVYLGQCFAGVFNYVNAGRGRGSDFAGTDVIFIGATNLHESLSSPTAEFFLHGQVSWVANLFLLHVFKWISNPVDIDGDGHHTIMDSYKYAGVLSNRSHKDIKSVTFSSMIDLHASCKDAEKAVSNPTGNPQQDMQNMLKHRSLRQQYQGLLGVNYVHQECWILNSYPAQSIEI
ncbi:hypothetical protein [Pantoea agglomerans]